MKTFFTIHAIARNQEGKILVLKRAEERRSAGKWNSVTGFVEGSESANEAALRELKEKTGLEGKIVKVGKPYWKVMDNIRWVIVPVLIDVTSAEISLDRKEHSEFKWVYPSDKFLNQTIAVFDSLKKLGLRK